MICPRTHNAARREGDRQHKALAGRWVGTNKIKGPVWLADLLTFKSGNRIFRGFQPPHLWAVFIPGSRKNYSGSS
jgi:hypothetical protein